MTAVLLTASRKTKQTYKQTNLHSDVYEPIWFKRGLIIDIAKLHVLIQESCERIICKKARTSVAKWRGNSLNLCCGRLRKGDNGKEVLLLWQIWIV